LSELYSLAGITYFFFRVTIIIAWDRDEKSLEAVAAIVLLLLPSFKISNML